MENNDIQLNKLNLLELTIMLEHLNSGYEHLEKVLNRKQINELLSLGELTHQQEKKLQSDTAEKSGEAAIMINGLLTGLLGMWLGLLGFVGLGGSSIPLLIIFSLVAAILSGVIGFSIFKTVKKEAHQSIIQQKINNIKIMVLGIINKKSENNIQKMITYLNWSLNYINEHTIHHKLFYKDSIPIKYSFKTKEILAFWYAELALRVKEYNEALPSGINARFVYKIKKITNKIRHMLLDDKYVSSLLALYAKRSNLNELGCPQIIASHSLLSILTKPRILSPIEIPKAKKWWQGRVTLLLIRFIPTMLGIMGSLFVYLTLPQAISQQLQSKFIEEIFVSPTARMIESFIAICFAIYFGYSFIYTQKEKWVRERELDKMDQCIANLETTRVLSESRSTSLMKIKAYVERIILIIKIQILLTSQKSA